MIASFPRRGEVWTVNFYPGRGSEQRGTRPALVIQNDVGNEHAATTIVAAITSTLKLYPVTVPLHRGEGGVRQASMVLRQRLGALSPERLRSVDSAIQVSLDVP